MSDGVEDQRDRTDSGKTSNDSGNNNDDKGGVKGLWQSVVVSGFDKEKNIGFFHKDLKEARGKAFKKYSLTSMIFHHISKQTSDSHTNSIYTMYYYFRTSLVV